MKCDIFTLRATHSLGCKPDSAGDSSQYARQIYIVWQWRNLFILYLCQLFFRHYVGQAPRNVCHCAIICL